MSDEILFNKPISVVDNIANFLRESIVSGKLKPGEKINEKYITATLGTSSIPFREATRILEKEGLIAYHPRRGNWVAEASRKDLLETFDTREMIEIFAIDLIKKNEKSCFALRDNLKSIMLNKETASLDSEFCVSFHHYIVELAGNSKLLAMYNLLSNNIRRYQRLSFTIRHDIGLCVEDHMEILKLLIDGDFEQAKFSIQEHLKNIRDTILRNMEFLD